VPTPKVHSTASAEFVHTETELSWFHQNGVPGSGSAIVVFVGAMDSEITSAASATFSGHTIQPMNFLGEFTGHGNAFPSIHAFILTEPTFSGGIIPESTAKDGFITVAMQQTTTSLAAMSVCVTGVDTAGGAIFGVPVFFQNTFLGADGSISGAVYALAEQLVLDCVVAQPGSPSSHTPGANQLLTGTPAALDALGTARMSVSYKVALNNGFEGMTREDITPLNTVSTALIVLRGWP
jgi:hypothetical protein